MTTQLVTHPATSAEPGPAVVVEALTTDDVRTAIRTAQDRQQPLAVKATGHGTLGTPDGGVLLDTSRMTNVLVDPDRRVARVGPGTRWQDVIAAAAPFGLAPVSGTAPSVGVTGYTLGGGLGWLSRKHGFAADNLLRAEIVTADGRLVTADAHRNADLFWAIRGGGGNFGIATSLEFRLHPVTQAYGGWALFPIERAAETIARYRDWTASQPDELTATIVLMKSPRPDVPGVSGPVFAIRGLYAGSPVDAVRALRPLWRTAGNPLWDGFRPITYAESGTIGGTAPRQFNLFADLSDTVIEAAVDVVADEASPAAAAEVRHWGGAMARPDADAGPAGHRDVPFSVIVDGPPSAATRLAAHATGGTFLNFLNDPTRTHTAFTPANYQPLRELKDTYDPGNLFRFGHNIPPSTLGQVETMTG